MLKNIITILFITLIIYGLIILILTNFVFPRKFQDIVEHVTKQYNVDPNLVYAIIKQESDFKEDAKSRSGAIGLMQIMTTTADEVVQTISSIDKNYYNLYDPETNISVGVKYISELIRKFEGNIYLTIAAYNGGMGNVQKWFEKDYSKYDSLDKVVEEIKFVETRKYVTNVIGYYNFYTKLY
ncbi:MAG: lytic transglycosylase domain-containing protein [Clostridia bacterium]|nr:lytic transglycosylase domain-containing protein [Clostridia bacterium]